MEQNEGTLRFETLDFRADNSFLARGVSNGQASPMAGKYKYEWGRLSLDLFTGKVREYEVTNWWGKKMEWKEQEDDKIILQRFERPADDSGHTPGLFERDPSRS